MDYDQDTEDLRNFSLKKEVEEKCIISKKIMPRTMRNMSKHSSQPITTGDMKFISQNPALTQYEKPILSKTGEVFSFDSETLRSITEKPIQKEVRSHYDESLLRSKQRLEKSLKKHYSTFKDNIFFRKSPTPLNAPHLGTTQKSQKVKNSQKSENLLMNTQKGLKTQKFKNTKSIKETQKMLSSQFQFSTPQRYTQGVSPSLPVQHRKRTITTAISNTRHRLKSANKNIRIHHTSKGNRNRKILGYSFEHKGQPVESSHTGRNLKK